MENVSYQKTGNTALITLHKQDTLNALCKSLIADINAGLDLAEADAEIYTIVITGCGKAFIAGADIDEMYGKTPSEIWDWSALGSGLNLRLEKMSRPVIAAINGYALGGGLELAMACDIRIASGNAKLGLPEAGLGVICGAGGTQRLPHIVGEGIAKEMIFTGKIINAEEAYRIGLVNWVVSPDALLEEAFALANSINQNGQLAVRAAKEAVRFARNAETEDGCILERQKFSALFETEDQKTGMGGFLRKEKNIVFKNR